MCLQEDCRPGEAGGGEDTPGGGGQGQGGGRHEAPEQDLESLGGGGEPGCMAPEKGADPSSDRNFALLGFATIFNRSGVAGAVL